MPLIGSPLTICYGCPSFSRCLAYDVTGIKCCSGAFLPAPCSFLPSFPERPIVILSTLKNLWRKAFFEAHELHNKECPLWNEPKTPSVWASLKHEAQLIVLAGLTCISSDGYQTHATPHLVLFSKLLNSHPTAHLHPALLYKLLNSHPATHLVLLYKCLRSH